MYVIGIDPGPVAGIVRLQLKITGDKWSGRGVHLVDAQALQVTPGVLTTVLEALTEGVGQAVALERFVVGPRSGRSATPAGGGAARDMVGAVSSWAHTRCRVYSRAAAEVKPWATDARLGATGLLDLTKGMRHARDAARHALFCATKDFGLTDPLSHKAGMR